jgi:hypothetical protein
MLFTLVVALFTPVLACDDTDAFPTEPLELPDACYDDPLDDVPAYDVAAYDPFDIDLGLALEPFEVDELAAAECAIAEEHEEAARLALKLYA